ncbi:hypothetical protein Taro_031667 [Colocasia esculenta]|uniref:Uncharacterized protein n=1 Tax=Colocasia esculenta TaxID=4460 RepID=A0A843VPG6_COLES|nr:hypothetical protein [Colocasia esculenta]
MRATCRTLSGMLTLCVFKLGRLNRAQQALLDQGRLLRRICWAIWHFRVVFGTLSPRGRRMERGRRRAVVGLCVLRKGVVLVGLHCSLACAYGAAVGPFVRDYETERRHSCTETLWWYLVVVGVEVEPCSVEVMWWGGISPPLLTLRALVSPGRRLSSSSFLRRLEEPARYYLTEAPLAPLLLLLRLWPITVTKLQSSSIWIY